MMDRVAWEIDLEGERRHKDLVMAKLQERADEYHEQFADSIIKALREGTTPWQKPWTWRQPRNFNSGRDYHGGNAVYLAMVALSRGYVDPRWGSVLQIRSAGGNVRKGEMGSPIWYCSNGGSSWPAMTAATRSSTKTESRRLSGSSGRLQRSTPSSTSTQRRSTTPAATLRGSRIG